jgi:hypothetical protein
MTDEELMHLAHATCLEISAAYQGELLRRHSVPDPVTIQQFVAAPIAKTLAAFRRQECAISESELGVFLGALMTITFLEIAVLNIGLQQALQLLLAKAPDDAAALVRQLQGAPTLSATP